MVERLILGGPLVVAPLALSLRTRAGVWRRSWETILEWSLLPCAAGLAVSAMVDLGPLSVALAAPWMGWTILAAAYCGLSALSRRLLPLSTLAIDAGFVYLPVGAAWWLASRAHFPLLGFDPVIVTLTAAHFHFAGLAASAIAGACGPLVEGRKLLYPVSTVLVVGTPILVALGILGSPTLEVGTAILLAIGVVGLSTCLLTLAYQRRARSLPAGLLALAALASFATMTLAVYFALGEFTGMDRPSILTMARSHGALNVLGFAIPALLGLRMIEAQ
jgi:hypothetical protein